MVSIIILTPLILITMYKICALKAIQQNKNNNNDDDNNMIHFLQAHYFYLFCLSLSRSCLFLFVLNNQSLSIHLFSFPPAQDEEEERAN